jgi:hypothetical protein
MATQPADKMLSWSIRDNIAPLNWRTARSWLLRISYGRREKSVIQAHLAIGHLAESLSDQEHK